jgi:hypothetical protein
MASRTPSILAGLGLAVLLTGVLAACASGSGGTPGDGVDGGDDVGGLEVSAAWLDDGRMIGLVTQGSSTCIPVAEDATLDGSTLTVTLADAEADQACTRDLVPGVTVVGVPEGVDPSKDLEIVVVRDGSQGDTDLDGVPGLAGPGGETDYLPSAGWTGDDGQFVILSWGSSTCVPAIENAEATSATEVTVTFATPPADQVCTMDMAPRGIVASVEGIEDDDAEVFAILEGAEFDNVRIPIIPN